MRNMSSLLTPTMAQNLAINECGSDFRRSYRLYARSGSPSLLAMSSLVRRALAVSARGARALHFGLGNAVTAMIDIEEASVRQTVLAIPTLVDIRAFDAVRRSGHA